MQPTQSSSVHERDKSKAITVSVNNHPVSFIEHRATGLQIKQAAIAQGVVIELDFLLYEVKAAHKLDPIADQEVVTLHEKKQEFRAVAPDDNS